MWIVEQRYQWLPGHPPWFLPYEMHSSQMDSACILAWHQKTETWCGPMEGCNYWERSPDSEVGNRQLKSECDGSLSFRISSKSSDKASRLTRTIDDDTHEYINKSIGIFFSTPKNMCLAKHQQCGTSIRWSEQEMECKATSIPPRPLLIT
jgi:hypothetical protein